MDKPGAAVVPTIRRILHLAGRDRGYLWAAMATVLVQAAMTVTFGYFSRLLVDTAISGQRAAFIRVFWINLGLQILTVPIAYFATWFAGRFSERAVTRVRQAVAEQVAVMTAADYHRRHSGDLVSVLTNDVNALKALTSGDLLALTRQVVTGIGAYTYLIILSWKLTLVATCAIPLIYVFMNRIIGPMSGRAAELQAEVGKVGSVAQDGLAGLTVTRAFNLEPQLSARFGAANDAALSKAMRIVRLRAAALGLSSGVPIAPFLITFAYGGYLTITGQMTPGAVLAFLNMLNNVSYPLTSVPRLIAGLSVATGGAARVLELLDLPGERTGGLATQPDTAAGTAVTFAGVDFAYESDQQLFTELTLVVKPGERVAVVGPSGGGKSTLLRLLLGFYQPSAGSVSLFGRNLDDWDLAAARRQMALVAQDSFLMPFSIAENIGCGRPDATRADIERAAQLANAHDFIIGLPDGYDTTVGERGARLSGGQRQRIAIARAILRDAPILLLDEATSALDNESEVLVQGALTRFLNGRTAIVIAHRLSTIVNADRVLVLAGGRIVEAGTHDELLAANGLYTRLFLRQFSDQEGGGRFERP